LTFEADCKQRNVPRMHILWLRAQCLICIKTDIEFPRGPEKPRNARSNFSAVTAMFWNSQSKKSSFLTWPDLAFGFAHPRDLGTRLHRWDVLCYVLRSILKIRTSLAIHRYLTRADWKLYLFVVLCLWRKKKIKWKTKNCRWAFCPIPFPKRWFWNWHVHNNSSADTNC